MARTDKTLDRVLSGTSDASISFEERVRGSHHIFWKNGVEEILNLQPKGNKAKPYQVGQIRNVILKCKLGGVLHGGE